MLFPRRRRRANNYHLFTSRRWSSADLTPLCFPTTRRVFSTQNHQTAAGETSTTTTNQNQLPLLSGSYVLDFFFSIKLDAIVSKWTVDNVGTWACTELENALIPPTMINDSVLKLAAQGITGTSLIEMAKKAQQELEAKFTSPPYNLPDGPATKLASAIKALSVQAPQQGSG